MNSKQVGATLRDSRIVELATGALWLYPFVDPSGMEVSVEDAVITIGGHGLDEDQVHRAMALLRDFTCVREVRDGTTPAIGRRAPEGLLVPR